MHDESGQCNTKGAAVRHAEKRRTSTCLFADRIARCCVRSYQQHVPLSFREEQKQTCLAAIVAFLRDDTPTTGDEEGEEARPSKSNRNSATTSGNRLFILGLGVGTKFLTEEILQGEIQQSELSRATTTDGRNDGTTEAFTGIADGQPQVHHEPYGRRVRDCHAEVLARRAFRRQLNLCMLHSLDPEAYGSEASETEFPPILDRTLDKNGSITFRLKPGISLHMYASSAPCGNATLKKFATMKKESFQEGLSVDEWPKEFHDAILGHSIHLGQFALLVKKDTSPTPSSSASSEKQSQTVPQHHSENATTDHTNSSRSQQQPNRKVGCPARETTDWCPPGTTTVWSGQGSLHSCSDKICLWNCLGIQGSLLASVLEQPMYIATLTVGRKLTQSICRRAVCCRAAAGKSKAAKKKKNEMEQPNENDNSYRINHPAIMGTAVYMDDSGVVDVDKDVRFHSTLSWAWWPAIAIDQSKSTTHANHKKDEPAQIECIDGATGFIAMESLDGPKDNRTPEARSENGGEGCPPIISRISTVALVELHQELVTQINSRNNNDNNNASSERKSATTVSMGNGSSRRASQTVVTLHCLREYKRQYSPIYETQKERLMSKHPLFRQWKRREKHEEITTT